MSGARTQPGAQACALFDLEPLPDATFGALLWLHRDGDLHAAIAALEARPDALPAALYAHDGLLLIPHLDAIAQAPELLLRLSRLFGAEVEDYRQTFTARGNIHPTVPQIFVVSNRPPTGRQPPPRPQPPLDAAGKLPIRFPHRRGWHTDQSYRRPPPDVSLFYAVQPAPREQAQTLYANGIAAYAALAPALRARIEGLYGLHVMPGLGRSEQAVRAGETPATLLPHQRAQRQPVVRVHPVTGARALFLCEAGQMDWVDGPFAGMQPGPDGDGARLLYELMAHYTDPRFSYAHAWQRGDLIVYDNRTLIHAATWFDAQAHERVMWRTTVAGNPGAEYAGERKSWLAG
jgi:taurine dioxygenase